MIRGLSAFVLLLVVAACGGASLPPAQASQPRRHPAAAPGAGRRHLHLGRVPAARDLHRPGGLGAAHGHEALHVPPAGRERRHRRAPVPRPEGRIAGRLVSGRAGAGRRRERRRAGGLDPGAARPRRERPDDGDRGRPERHPARRRPQGRTGRRPAPSPTASRPCPCSTARPSTTGSWWATSACACSSLDLPGGGTVVVDLDAFDGDQVEDLIARSAGIVRSLSFDTSGAPASALPSLPVP